MSSASQKASSRGEWSQSRRGHPPSKTETPSLFSEPFPPPPGFHWELFGHGQWLYVGLPQGRMTTAWLDPHGQVIREIEGVLRELGATKLVLYVPTSQTRKISFVNYEVGSAQEARAIVEAANVRKPGISVGRLGRLNVRMDLVRDRRKEGEEEVVGATQGQGNGQVSAQGQGQGPAQAVTSAKNSHVGNSHVGPQQQKSEKNDNKKKKNSASNNNNNNNNNNNHHEGGGFKPAGGAATSNPSGSRKASRPTSPQDSLAPSLSTSTVPSPVPSFPFSSKRQAPQASAPVSPPLAFLCPLSGLLMVDPVTTSSGVTYERSVIENYIIRMTKLYPSGVLTDPREGVEMTRELTQNTLLKRAIETWRVANGGTFL